RGPERPRVVGAAPLARRARADEQAARASAGGVGERRRDHPRPARTEEDPPADPSRSRRGGDPPLRNRALGRPKAAPHPHHRTLPPLQAPPAQPRRMVARLTRSASARPPPGPSARDGGPSERADA